MAAWREEVPDIPDDNRLGTGLGWLDVDGNNASYKVDEDADTLTVTIATNENLVLELQMAKVSGSCTGRVQLWRESADEAITDVSGCAVLLTSKGASAIEFEIVCGVGWSGFVTYIGRAFLGDKGLHLSMPHRSDHERLVEHDSKYMSEAFLWKDRVCIASGLVDSLGRRQGFWCASDAVENIKCESTWIDGLPSGPTVTYKDDRRIRMASYMKGLLSGLECMWDKQGKLFKTKEYFNGIVWGAITRYYPSGTKASEGYFVGSAEIAPSAKWKQDGEFEGFVPAAVIDGIGSSQTAIAARITNLTEFQAAIQGWATRKHN